MSDYTPTMVESLGNEIARVRKGQNITAGDLAQRLGPWLIALIAEKQAEALLMAAKAGAGYKVSPHTPGDYREGAMHADSYWQLALIGSATQLLREQAANQQDG